MPGAETQYRNRDLKKVLILISRVKQKLGWSMKTYTEPNRKWQKPKERYRISAIRISMWKC